MNNPKSAVSLIHNICIILDDPVNYRRKDTIPKMKPIVEELYNLFINKPSYIKTIMSVKLPNLLNYFTTYTKDNHKYPSYDYITSAIINSFSQKYLY